MSQTRLHIDQIALQIKGLDPVIAQSLAQGLGPALLQAIAQQPELSSRLRAEPTLQPARFDLGQIQISPHQDLKAIHQTIAQTALAAIARTNPTPPRSSQQPSCSRATLP
jgi:hypothetical protein